MKLEEKDKAIQLRKRGYSLNEISTLLNVTKSTASFWLRDISLSGVARSRLRRRIKKGVFVAAEKKKAKSKELNTYLKKEASEELKDGKISEFSEKLLCALIYWCEGAKDYRGGIAFSNSDPNLARKFIDLLEKTFSAKRDKFIVRLHLHDYHSKKVQTEFWAKGLRLAIAQFRKPYRKPNTGKRIRINYPGCISIRYYDNILSRKIMYLAQSYLGYQR
ncbi:MAG: hypothetical protein ABH833_01030 [Parcubacteria group bacterium]